MGRIELRTLGTLDLRAADGRELHSLLAQPKRIEFPLAGYAVAPDPRLLTFRLLHPGAPDTLVVVENWFEELKTSHK